MNWTKKLDRLTESDFNDAMDAAAAMMHERPNARDAIYVATVARLMFGVGKRFPEKLLLEACQDSSVALAAWAVVDLAETGMRL